MVKSKRGQSIHKRTKSKRGLIWLVVGLVLVSSLLVWRWQSASASQTTPLAESTRSIKTSSSQKNSSQKRAHDKNTSSASPADQDHADNEADQVSGIAKALDSQSDPDLVKLISETMATIKPGPAAPARWTVAVQDLQNKHQAYVSDWTPAKAQFSASTIKLFILIRYYQCLQAGKISEDDTYVLAQKDVVAGSGELYHLPLGSTYTLKQLAELMMKKSDNIATNVLIDRLGGFAAINHSIHVVVGAGHQTSVERKMMDTRHVEDGRANRINAQEVVTVLLKIYQNKLLGSPYDQKILALMAQAENKTKLPAQLPAEANCYNKSGESNFRGIENDLAIIEYQGHILAICALVQMDGDADTPHNATASQTNSEIEALGQLGQKITMWYSQHK